MPKKILIPPYSPKLRNPPYPEHVTEELRERMRKGPVTLSRDELKRIIAMLEILSDRCGAAYQAVGKLADYGDISEDPAVVKAMDLLAFPLRRGSFSPFNPKKIMEKNRAEWQSRQSDGKRRAVSGAVSRSASRPKKKP
jgi:hypothetical protein